MNTICGVLQGLKSLRLLDFSRWCSPVSLSVQDGSCSFFFKRYFGVLKTAPHTWSWYEAVLIYREQFFIPFLIQRCAAPCVVVTKDNRVRCGLRPKQPAPWHGQKGGHASALSNRVASCIPSWLNSISLALQQNRIELPTSLRPNKSNLIGKKSTETGMCLPPLSGMPCPLVMA